MRIFTAAVASLAAISICGCGYRPLLRDARAPGGVSRVAIPLMINETQLVGLEAELTGYLVDHLDRYHGVQVTDHAPEAVLQGTFRQLMLRPTNASGSTGTLHQAYRVTLLMDLELVRSDSGEVLWQVNGLRRDSEHDMGPIMAGEDILSYEQLRRQAALAVGCRLLEEGVELMMGGS